MEEENIFLLGILVGIIFILIVSGLAGLTPAQALKQKCAKNAEFEKYTATTQFYAWYVWQKGFSGDTILKWI